MKAARIKNNYQAPNVGELDVRSELGFAMTGNAGGYDDESFDDPNGPGGYDDVDW